MTRFSRLNLEDLPIWKRCQHCDSFNTIVTYEDRYPYNIKQNQLYLFNNGMIGTWLNCRTCNTIQYISFEEMKDTKDENRKTKEGTRI